MEKHLKASRKIYLVLVEQPFLLKPFCIMGKGENCRTHGDYFDFYFVRIYESASFLIPRLFPLIPDTIYLLAFLQDSCA